MDVILLQDIANLGFKDEVVSVKNGYARNYLIPQGFAINATSSNKKILAENLRQRAHKLEKIKNEAVELAERLNELSLTIATKTSSTGKIFGSVNTILIAEALKNKGFDIDRKKILIKQDQIKEVGKYTAEIKLHKEVSVSIELDVISE